MTPRFGVTGYYAVRLLVNSISRVERASQRKRACKMATQEDVITFSYQQARAKFAHKCAAAHSRERILEFYNALPGEQLPLDTPLSSKQLAFKLAWKILPAGPITHVK